MMVARYSDEYTSGLPSDYNGRYVKYDDYEELEAECNHLQLEVACMQATIDALTRKCTELQDELARATCDKERITSELFEAACNDLGDAQATLDALREAVPEYFTPENNYLWQNSLAKVLDILYPAKKGEANGNDIF